MYNVHPSEGFPRLAYLGPGAGWDGCREDFEDSQRSGVSIRAQGPWAQGPWAQGPWAQESANKHKSRQKKSKRHQNHSGGHNFEKIIAGRRAQGKTQNLQKRTKSSIKSKNDFFIKSDNIFPTFVKN